MHTLDHTVPPHDHHDITATTTNQRRAPGLHIGACVQQGLQHLRVAP